MDQIGKPDVVPILVARLTEVDFGFAAAMVLKSLSDRENGRPDQAALTARWPNFAAAAQRRAEKAGGEAAIDAPPADVIFNAVAKLRRNGTTDR